MKKYLKIGLVAIAFIASAGSLTGLYLYNKQHKDLNKIKSDYIVSAVDLLREFESDEKASSTKYIGKIVEVSGIIQSVNTGEENILSINLNSGSDFSSVICTFSPENHPSDIAPGKQVTIKGECSGFLMDVLLNNCVLVK